MKSCFHLGMSRKLTFLLTCIVCLTTVQISHMIGQPLEWLPNDQGLVPATPLTDIQMVDAEDDHSVHARNRGLLSHLFEIKAPLAWRISTGRPEIVIDARDQFYTKDTISGHPDMIVQDSAEKDGNFIYISPEYAAAQTDGIFSTKRLTSNHGVKVLGVAVALGDNDDPNIEGQGHVGVAYQCRGIGENLPSGPIYVDTDLKKDGILTPPAIGFDAYQMHFSFEQIYRHAIDTGIVWFAPVGNARGLSFSDGTFFYGDNDTLTLPSGEEVNVVVPKPYHLTRYVWADSSDTSNPLLDYKIIAVGGMRDYTEVTLAELGPNSCRYNENYAWRGEPEFHPEYNFAPGKNKFPLDSSATVRLEHRRRAMLDLVAPAGEVMTVCGDSIGYRPRDGTSMATPIVTGVAGLMLSVDRWLGVHEEMEWDSVQRTFSNGPELQRRMHSLLTFTADKLQDRNNIPNTPPVDSINDGTTVPVKIDTFSNRYYYLSDYGDNREPIQFDYVEQVNDPLRRSWAQRMGFGRVNAYRAVAHAIPYKAPQYYEASQTLPFYDNRRGPLGQRILHMGAWYREGPTEDLNNNGVPGEVLDLYEAGGASLPGEDHNNQGVTMLSGPGITLTVPGDATLAIDGIVTTDDPDGGGAITTSGDGDIVAEGMLDNVELSGKTFVGDLIVRGDAGMYGCLMAGPAQSDVCEVFGNVTMRDSGAVVVKGWMRMRPGGQITMSGDRDIIVKPGGTLEMMYGSRIERNADTHFDRMIVIDSGATLMVPDGAHVDVFTHVYVLPYGRVEIGENAAVSMDHFRVEQDGEFQVREGAHLALRDRDYYNECQGHLIFEGVDGNMARVTGRFPEIELSIGRVECEGVVDFAKIIAKGFTDDIEASSLQMIQTTFSNVAIQAVNISFSSPQYEWIWDCSFTASRSLGMPWRNLVEVVYWPDEDDPVLAPREYNAAFTRCTFADEDGTHRVDRTEQNYWLKGLLAMGTEQTQVEDCRLRHLTSGVRVLDNLSASLRRNDGFIVDNYIHIAGPGTESSECANTAQSVWRSGIYTTTARSLNFDPAYSNIHSGVIGTSADRVWMRGGHFDFFVEGVRSVGSTVFLRPNENPGQVDEFGRNVFVVNPRTQPRSEFFDHLRIRRDCFMERSGIVLPSCGLNDFAAETDYHIDSDYLSTVLATSNRWNNPDGQFYVRRGPLVQVLGNQLDQSESAMGCGTDEDFLSCPPPPELDQLGGMNPFGPVMDSTPDSVYVRALDDLADPALLPTVRRARAKDTFRAALKSDSTEQRLDTLRGWIGTILAADTTVTSDTLLRGGLMYLDGVILEHLRRYPEARMAFELVCQTVPTSPDSMLAGWRLLKLDVLAGESSGSAYDADMTAFTERIDEDLQRYRTPPLLQARRGGEPDLAAQQSLCKLMGIAPNPFGDKTTIRVEVGTAQHVRIEIADMQGRVIAVVCDRRFDPGTHTIELRNEGFVPGVYLCHMQSANGSGQTELLTIK